MNQTIYSQCVYDVDNHYVDINIREVGSSFVLTVSETSDYEAHDSEIEIYLTKDNLESIILRLSEVTKK